MYSLVYESNEHSSLNNDIKKAVYNEWILIMQQPILL